MIKYPEKKYCSSHPKNNMYYCEECVLLMERNDVIDEMYKLNKEATPTVEEFRKRLHKILCIDFEMDDCERVNNIIDRIYKEVYK